MFKKSKLVVEMIKSDQDGRWQRFSNAASTIAEYAADPELAKTHPAEYENFKNVIAFSMDLGAKMKKTQYILGGIILGVVITYALQKKEKSDAHPVRAVSNTKANN